MKTAKFRNTWKEVKTFNSKIFKDFIQTGTRLSLAHFLITRTMCSTWNWSCISLLFNFYLIFFKICQVPLHFTFPSLYSSFLASRLQMYELWSGIPMGLGTPIENIWASLSVKSAEVGEPKKCAQMGKPSGCHEFICLLFLFVAYCILVFACNEVFVFAADQRERFVCWRLIPAPFSFPHHHIVIRPATTAHICWILTMILQYKYWYCYIAIDCRP